MNKTVEGYSFDEIKKACIEIVQNGVSDRQLDELGRIYHDPKTPYGSSRPSKLATAYCIQETHKGEWLEEVARVLICEDIFYCREEQRFFFVEMAYG